MNNGSLNLHPMNSADHTAARVGLEVHTLNPSLEGIQQQQDKFAQHVSQQNTVKLNHQAQELGSGEDLVPPYNSSMCVNNSLVNNSNVLLGAEGGSLDLRPQKKTTLEAVSPLGDDPENTDGALYSESRDNSEYNDNSEQTNQLSKSSSEQEVKSEINNDVEGKRENYHGDKHGKIDLSESELQMQQINYQRQLFEQKLEQKKMEQFRKLHQVSSNANDNHQKFAKSMSPMSPRAVTPLSQINSELRGSGNNLNSAESTHFPGQMGASHTHTAISTTTPTTAIHTPSPISATIGTPIANREFISNGTASDTHIPRTFMSTESVIPSTHFSPPRRRPNSPFHDNSNLHIKQINDNQRPIYTPAVLRVTKDTPSQSSYIEPGFDVNKTPDRPFLTKSTSNASAKSTASSIIDYWNYLTGRVPDDKYDGPSRIHWKPDSSRFNCEQCGKLFNYLTESRRRHHCRSCGGLFCGTCLRNYIYLDKDAKFTLFGREWDDDNDNDYNADNGEAYNPVDDFHNGGGNNKNRDNCGNTQLDNVERARSFKTVKESPKYLCKVCHLCFQKYEEYVLDHTTRDHNLGTNGKDLNKTSSENRDQKADTQSVPADWDWSSF